MTSLLPLLALVQEGVGSASTGSPPPFSVLELGKALFSLSFLSLVTVVVTARAALRLKERGSEARSRVDDVLFWGVFTFGVGLFHVFMSLTSTLQSIQLYGPLPPEREWLVARGLMLGTLAGAWGLLVLLLAALAWLGLRRRHRSEPPEPA
jgi:hypothetical protein